jgi:UDP-N-acetylmuramate dehydrogenase
VTIEDLAARLSAVMRGRVEENRSLATLTTYRLGGPARIFVEPADAADLEALWRALGEAGGIDVLTIGRGSNLVVADEGWPGVAVRIGPAFSWIEPWSSPAAGPGLSAGAGTPLPTVANWAARRGLAGLEWLVAVPGSVGGAVRMNAGAHGGAVAETLRRVRLFDLGGGKTVTRQAPELGLSYRRSNLSDRELVLEAFFELDRVDTRAIRERMESFRRHRSATQPGALQNAGSTFKNPPGDAAGRLVEAAGLKGLRVGEASVSKLHANFFMAGEGATAQDVYDLVREVQATVHARFGIELEPELRFAGRFDSAGVRRAARDRQAVPRSARGRPDVSRSPRGGRGAPGGVAG